VAARARGDTPLFLLDDLSSELDRARTARLVEVLLGLEAQVWVSTTDPDHIAGLPPGDTQRLRVRDGRLSAD
jgi:recombinational DNA repair ATPase RecF